MLSALRCVVRRDLLLAGNFHPLMPALGRLDASHGVLLRGLGNGRFEAVDPETSGVFLEGQVRGLASLRQAGGLRLLLLALLAGATALMIRRFLALERAAGRFAPLPDVGGEAWLKEHVFRWPPELVGAAWDGSTAAPEVAGLLARLVQEGKLASRVEDDDGDPVAEAEAWVAEHGGSHATTPRAAATPPTATPAFTPGTASWP